MLGLYENTAIIRGKINNIRNIYNGNTNIQAALDDVNTVFDGLESKAKGIVEEKITSINVLSAAQCLGTQLPIPDMDSAFENFSKILESLSGGSFLSSLDYWLDNFLANLPADALAEIQNLKSLILEKINVVDTLILSFENFGNIQRKIQKALGTIATFIGCSDNATGANLGRHLSRLDSAMDELNPDFKAGKDAVEVAESHFTKPTDILTDAKARVTANLNLDGLMEDVTNEFSSGLNDLL